MQPEIKLEETPGVFKPQLRSESDTPTGLSVSPEDQAAPASEADSLLLHAELKAQISARAYQLYEILGRLDAQDLDDWLQAEHEIWAARLAISESSGCHACFRSVEPRSPHDA